MDLNRLSKEISEILGKDKISLMGSPDNTEQTIEDLKKILEEKQKEKEALEKQVEEAKAKLKKLEEKAKKIEEEKGIKILPEEVTEEKAEIPKVELKLPSWAKWAILLGALSLTGLILITYKKER